MFPEVLILRLISDRIKLKYTGKYILNIITVIILGIFLSLLSACSSSSYSSRYNKNKNKTSTTKNKSVRFSSEDNIKSDDKNNSTDEEFDEEPVESNPVNSEEFFAKYNNLKNLGVALTPREKIIFEVIDYLDTPYQYGGNTKRGIDCSGFTTQVFEKAIGFSLPRTASEQFNNGQRISSMSNLKFGDLVFFNTTKRKFPGHVGIYLGNNLFVHSSVSKGVTVSSLQSDYWKRRFVGGRRIEQVFEK